MVLLSVIYAIFFGAIMKGWGHIGRPVLSSQLLIEPMLTEDVGLSGVPTKVSGTRAGDKGEM